jgi:hypothetical protein
MKEGHPTGCATSCPAQIGCGCTHGEQLAAALLDQVEMFMPLQRFKQGREKGHEAFGADTVGGVPDQEQGVLDFLPVMAWARTMRDGLLHFCMVEEPHRVFAIVSCCCGKGIQQFTLFLDRLCLAILRDHAASVMLVWFAGSIRFPRLPPLALSCVRCSSEMTEYPLVASLGI